MSNPRSEWLRARLVEFMAVEPALVVFVAEQVALPAEVPVDDGTAALSFSPRYEADTHLTSDGVTQRCSFKGTWHTIFVPWTAVIHIRDSWRSVNVAPVEAESEAPLPKARSVSPFTVIQGGKTDA